MNKIRIRFIVPSSDNGSSATCRVYLIFRITDSGIRYVSPFVSRNNVRTVREAARFLLSADLDLIPPRLNIPGALFQCLMNDREQTPRVSRAPTK
jgi:hypothetical protein